MLNWIITSVLISYKPSCTRVSVLLHTAHLVLSETSWFSITSSHLVPFLQLQIPKTEVTIQLKRWHYSLSPVYSHHIQTFKKKRVNNCMCSYLWVNLTVMLWLCIVLQDLQSHFLFLLRWYATSCSMSRTNSACLECPRTSFLASCRFSSRASYSWGLALISNQEKK